MGVGFPVAVPDTMMASAFSAAEDAETPADTGEMGDLEAQFTAFSHLSARPPSSRGARARRAAGPARRTRSLEAHGFPASGCFVGRGPRGGRRLGAEGASECPSWVARRYSSVAAPNRFLGAEGAV